MTFTRAALAAAAGIDPWALHGQVAGGDPDQIEHLAAKFFKAARCTTEAAQAEARSRHYADHGYQVGGQAVHGHADGYTRTVLHADREHLPAIAKILVGVGDELANAQRGTAAQLDTLATELEQVQTTQRTTTASVGHALPRDDQLALEHSYFTQAVAHVRTRGAAVAKVVDSYEVALAAASKSLSALGYVAGEQLDLGAPPPVPGRHTAPTAVAAWWATLSPGERQALLRSSYSRLSRLQGLPATVLDQANRHVLHDYEAHLHAGIAAAGAGTVLALMLATRLRRCAQVERTLAAGTSRSGRRYLLHFDPGAPMNATGVAVAIGDPDHAADTTVFIPGTTHSAADLTEVAPTGQALYDHMGGSSKSVIVWLDGPIPPHIAPQAALDRYADTSGPRLVADLAGLHAAHQAAGGSREHVTAVGHSYGSTLLGRALLDGGHRYVDDAVFVGSPGVGVDHARDLGMDPQHVWSGQAGDDPILLVGNRFTPGLTGLNPEESGFGAQHFDVSGSHGHSHYFEGTSLTNITRIADGAYGAVHTVDAPDYRGPRELPTDLLDATVLDGLGTDRAVLGDVFDGDLDQIDDDALRGLGAEARDLLHTGEDVLGTGQVHCMSLSQATAGQLALGRR